LYPRPKGGVEKAREGPAGGAPPLSIVGDCFSPAAVKEMILQSKSVQAIRHKERATPNKRCITPYKR